MSVWQYDFILVPRDELVAQIGSLPARLSPDEINLFRLWTTQQPIGDYAERFSNWQKEFQSWAPNTRFWGHEESNRIDVSLKDGRVQHIEFRLELRSINIRFIQTIVDMARDSNCVLVSAHSFDVVEPLREHIISYLAKSNGAHEVWDWLQDPARLSRSKHAPRVFLSHSSMDKPFVSKLAVDLRGNNIPVWYDKWELKVGDSLSSKIASGIHESGWLAIVLSKNSVASAWVERELNAALAIELNKKDVFILPLVIDDCSVPLFLQDKVYADFRGSYQNGLHSVLARIMESKGI